MDATPTLAAQGISKKESMTWQKLADIPAPVFEKKLIAVKAQGEKLTTKAVLAVTKLVQKDKEKPDMKLDVAETIQKLSKRWPEWTKRIEILEMMSHVSEGLASFSKDSKDWPEARRIQTFNTFCVFLLENYKG